MRTKALFVAAAVGAAGLVSSMAQVYSVNVVGYVNKQLQPGWNLISNPLTASSNSITDLLPGVDGMIVYKFDGGWINQAEYLDLGGGTGVWSEDFNVVPGEGIFVNLPPAAGATTVTFVGEITAGTKSIAVPSGWSIRSSIVPAGGGIVSDLQFPAADGDIVYKWDAAGQMYIGAFEYFDGVGWTLDGNVQEPEIEVGEAFWAAKQAGTTWTREFTVGN